MRGERWPPRIEAAYSNTENNMDNNTMWEGLLAIIRALILGRRLPPDQLRTFLLFAEPVPYLSAEQIAAAIGRNCGHDIEPELPEGWAQGVSINDPECGDYFDADAQIVGEILISLLDKEHPEWKHDAWKVTTCDQGWDFLSYRVLDERGRVHPIACWMEGKLKLLRDGAIKDEAARRTVICRFIERTLEWLWETVGDWESEDLPEDYQEAAAKLHGFFESRAGDYTSMYPVLERCAAHIFDSGQWEIDEWMDYWVYAPLLWDALNDLGYIEATSHTQTKNLFAA